MRTTLVIYSPAIVLAVWSAVLALGGTGQALTAVGVLVLLGAVVAHGREEYRGPHER